MDPAGRIPLITTCLEWNSRVHRRDGQDVSQTSRRWSFLCRSLLSVGNGGVPVCVVEREDGGRQHWLC